jgi:hypothetical protein
VRDKGDGAVPRRSTLALGVPLALIRLVSPDSDPEIIAIVAMLEAHGIPSFIRGGGMGGLFPGVQINAYNSRDIMIPEADAITALELLKDFQSREPEPEPIVKPRRFGVLRNFLELLLFGWFVPGSRSRTDCRDARSGGAPNNRWSGRAVDKVQRPPL